MSTEERKVTTLRSDFGRRLRQIRRSKDLTQEQIAVVTGLSVEFISNIERGRNAPSFETIEKLAKVLETPIDAFFQFDEIRNR
ncbi:helix-turn-helix domain-containing protein [Chloroflexota bacterium]